MRSVRFGVKEREAIGIGGESGSGKSTIERCIVLLYTPTSGYMYLEGTDLARERGPAMHTVGRWVQMIFQDPISSLNPVMIIESQLLEALDVHLGLKAQAARTRARELLEAVGISDAARRLRAYSSWCSGGMHQRVMIAIAIAAILRLLIADEPTTALSVTAQAQILESIKSAAPRPQHLGDPDHARPGG